MRRVLFLHIDSEHRRSRFIHLAHAVCKLQQLEFVKLGPRTINEDRRCHKEAICHPVLLHVAPCHTARDRKRMIADRFPYHHYFLWKRRHTRLRRARRDHIHIRYRSSRSVRNVLELRLVLERHAAEVESLPPRLTRRLEEIMGPTFRYIVHAGVVGPERTVRFGNVPDGVTVRRTEHVEPDPYVGETLARSVVILDQLLDRYVVIDQKNTIGAVVRGKFHIAKHLCARMRVNNRQKYMTILELFPKSAHSNLLCLNAIAAVVMPRILCDINASIA